MSPSLAPWGSSSCASCCPEGTTAPCPGGVAGVRGSPTEGSVNHSSLGPPLLPLPPRSLAPPTRSLLPKPASPAPLAWNSHQDSQLLGAQRERRSATWVPSLCSAARGAACAVPGGRRARKLRSTGPRERGVWSACGFVCSFASESELSHRGLPEGGGGEEAERKCERK